LYKLLSLAFKYPTLEIFETLKNGDYFSELRDKISSLTHLRNLGVHECINKAQRELRGINLQDFQAGFVQTFDGGISPPPCAAYESLYREGSWIDTVFELSEFYRHFGLKVTQEKGKREFPDHLCTELEFLQFLAAKEDRARRDGNRELLKECMMAQKDFLEHHLIKWFPNFFKKLQGNAKNQFYIELAMITLRFINSDLKWVSKTLQEFELQ